MLVATGSAQLKAKLQDKSRWRPRLGFTINTLPTLVFERTPGFKTDVYSIVP